MVEWGIPRATRLRVFLAARFPARSTLAAFFAVILAAAALLYIPPLSGAIQEIVAFLLMVTSFLVLVPDATERMPRPARIVVFAGMLGLCGAAIVAGRLQLSYQETQERNERESLYGQIAAARAEVRAERSEATTARTQTKESDDLLIATQGEMIKLQKWTKDELTGGDSFAIATLAATAPGGMIPSIIHKGNGPAIQNVRVRFVNTALHGTGVVRTVGDVGPDTRILLEDTVVPFTGNDDEEFRIFFTSTYKRWTQYIRLKRQHGGEWGEATRIYIDHDASGRPPRLALQCVDRWFPPGQLDATWSKRIACTNRSGPAELRPSADDLTKMRLAPITPSSPP